jgi:hypothetical protein
MEKKYLDLIWVPTTHFRIGRHENKEKRLFYFGLRILLAIQIQLLKIENPKNREKKSKDRLPPHYSTVE